MEPTSSNNKKTQLLYKLFLRGYKNPILSIGMGQRSRSNSCILAGADYKNKSSQEQMEQRYKRRQRTPDEETSGPPPPPFLSLVPINLEEEMSSSPSVRVVELGMETENLPGPEDRHFPNQNQHQNQTDSEYRRPRQQQRQPQAPARVESKLSNLKWACETLDKRKDLIADFFQRSILKQRQDHEEDSETDEHELLPHLQVQDASTSSSPSPNLNTYCVVNINPEHYTTASLSPEPIYAEICGESDIKPGIAGTSSIRAEPGPGPGPSSLSRHFSHRNRQRHRSEEQEDPFHISKNGENYDTVQDFVIERGADHLYENLDIIRHEMLLKHEKAIYFATNNVDCLDLGLDMEVVKESSPSLVVQVDSEKSGEIDEESIIENKPAIKSYWETKMRENAASQFARSNFGVTSPTITDKINEEIREDYMRNLELMTDEGLPRSSDSDTSDEPTEFDSFDMASSSNGSSPFGQPNDASSPIMMLESPTLIDSGHQSQESNLLSENESSDRPTYDGNSNGQSKLTGGSDYSSLNGSTKNLADQQQGKKGLGNVRVGSLVAGYRNTAETARQPPAGNGKIENHVTHYITFNKPFSRPVKPTNEVRTQERETSPPKSTQQQPKEIVKESAEDKFGSQPLKMSQVQESSVKPVKADISYMLAASRLKKEIEDNLKRERELKDEGRVRTLSVDTVLSSPSDPSLPPLEFTSQVQRQRSESEEPEVEVQKNVSTFKSHESPKETIKNDAQAQVAKFEAMSAQKNAEQHQQPSKAQIMKRDIIPTPANKPQQELNLQPQPQPIVLQQSTQPSQSQPQPQQPQATQAPVQSIRQPLPSFKIGKNFNSMERYIMYSSLTKLNLRSMPPTPTNSVFSPTDMSISGFETEQGETTGEPESNSTENPFSRQEKEEITEVVVPEPSEKIRKNYIPTEKKIKDELLEMVQREEELKKTRQQWKSTPNLSNLNFGEDEEEMEEVQHRQVPTRRVAEKRRRSALISKWEEMISKYNQ